MEKASYKRLCEIAVSLNEEREALIALRKNLSIQMGTITDRLIELDKQVEENLDIQELFWPKPEEPYEIIPMGALINDFVANPDQTLVGMGKKYNISPSKVSKILTRRLTRKTA